MKNFIKRHIGYVIFAIVFLIVALSDQFGDKIFTIELTLGFVTAWLATQTNNIMKKTEISESLENKYFDLTIMDTGFHMHYNLFNFEYKKGAEFIKIPTKDVRQIWFNGYKKHKSNQIGILYMDNKEVKRVTIEAEELKDVFFTIFLPSMCEHQAKSNKNKPIIRQSITLY